MHKVTKNGKSENAKPLECKWVVNVIYSQMSLKYSVYSSLPLSPATPVLSPCAGKVNIWCNLWCCKTVIVIWNPWNTIITIAGCATLILVRGDSERKCILRCGKTVVVIWNLRKIVFVYMTIAKSVDLLRPRGKWTYGAFSDMVKPLRSFEILGNRIRIYDNIAKSVDLLRPRGRWQFRRNWR